MLVVVEEQPRLRVVLEVEDDLMDFGFLLLVVVAAVDKH